MSLFSVLRIAVVAVLLSLVLSGCFGISDAEFRAKTCPNCTDAQWSATKAEIKKKQDEKAYAQFLVKKECSDRCGRTPGVLACKRDAANLRKTKASQAVIDAKEWECTVADMTCSHQCFGSTDSTVLNITKAETAEQIANSIMQSMPADGPAIDQPVLQVSGHHPGVGTFPNREPQISDTPLWTCLDKNNWRTRTFGDGKSALSCISAKNSKGSTFTVSADFRAFNPPNKDNFDWSNPTSYLKLFTAGCNARAGKVVATSAPNPAVVALNLGAKACRELRDSMQSKGPGYLGEYEIYLDGELVQSCPTFKPKGYAKIMDHIYCFQLMLANKNNRSKLATYTGVRPSNKFGSPDAVHILHSCANKSNWASYGRDATSEEVGVCKSRDTIQTGSPYWVEARQLNLGDGKETIKITIGMSRSKSLNRTENTRIQNIALTYHCGNKSFDRMRKEPRETSAACINDMLGLVNANLGSLNSEQRSNAKHITALGGYGRTNAEEIHILTCRDTRLGPGCKG